MQSQSPRYNEFRHTRRILCRTGRLEPSLYLPPPPNTYAAHNSPIIHTHLLRPATSRSHSPRFSDMVDRHPTHKVAICRVGRLDHDRKSLKIDRNKSRVRRACSNCHNRKIGCNGKQPHCQNCVEQHTPCVYPQARKDRLKESVSQTRGFPH